MFKVQRSYKDLKPTKPIQLHYFFIKVLAENKIITMLTQIYLISFMNVFIVSYMFLFLYFSCHVYLSTAVSFFSISTTIRQFCHLQNNLFCFTENSKHTMFYLLYRSYYILFKFLREARNVLV